MKSSTLGRLACVDLPAFPLQLLLKRHPDWVDQPAAVVAEDKPQGLILWVNERARQSGVLPGLRYAAALSLAAGLRAGEVAAKEIAESVSELTRRLMRFSPEVEPAAGE
ncbi:MAG TPA: DNA polymerase Y family protein, partial [Candidatus Binatia bacterium]|nr:DNA polymerase Y family protein [Candidatus Binatia bacterium]